MNIKSSNFIEKFAKAELEFGKYSRKRRINQISTFGMKRQSKFLTQASNPTDLDLRMNINSSNFIEKFAKAELEFGKYSRKRRINQISTFGMKRQSKFLSQASNQSDLDLRMNINSSNFIEKFVKTGLES
jgi:hypothetical protein